MTIRMNISMIRTLGRSVMSCCHGSSWALRIGVVSATLLLFANAGQAQFPARPDGVGAFGAYYPWLDGVGTAERSTLDSYANMIDRTTMRGMVEAEKARGLYIQNREEAYRAYWAGKEPRSAIAAQKRENSPHPAGGALKIAGKSNAAEPLSAELLNPETGKIVWPKALLDSKYTAKRTEIEKLFELRAKTSGGPNSQTKIQVATGEMAALLKANITTMSSTDYMNAKKFLDSLAVSAG